MVELNPNNVQDPALQRAADVALMLRIKQGDMSAFQELVEAHQQLVLKLVYRWLQDATEAEDMTQNVFLNVFRSAHRYNPSAKVSTWLSTIAKNLCLNELRRRSRHPAHTLEGTPGLDRVAPQYEDKEALSPAGVLLHQELRELINLALSGLPEKQRVALLCRQDHISYEEISAVIGCSVQATKSTIHRARQSMKEILKPYLRSGYWPEAMPPVHTQPELDVYGRSTWVAPIVSEASVPDRLVAA